MAKLGELLQNHQDAFKKGILSRLELTSVQIAYYDAKGQISKNQNFLIELNQKKNDYVESWNAKIRDLQAKFAQSKYDLEKLEQNIELTETVKSPVDGIISNNYVKPGDFVGEKQVVSNIITYSDDLEVIAFVNDEIAKKITISMPAKIFPQHINSLEYGGLVGKVIYVSALPIPSESMESLLENKKMVEKIQEKGPVFKIKIELTPSPNAASGYLWTTSAGPQEKITVGSVAEVGIVIKKERPLNVIIHVAQSTTNGMLKKNE